MTNAQTQRTQKNILFLVTGMTPQIVTETLWALACDSENTEQWIPDEIHVLSTKKGVQQIKDRLLKKVFANMQIEYPQLVNVRFDETCLEVIANNNGDLDDIKTSEDNQLMADRLCTKIRDYCGDDNSSLHVSIAGGRKTMGFYAGYALSLYGRGQDRLSHVLVEEKYEYALNFFYPTTAEYPVKNRNEEDVGDAKDAKVWLANIPFVRMQQAIKEKHQLNSKDSFIEVINKVNESFNDVSLKLNINNRSILINDSIQIDSLPPREFALLHWFADLKKNQPEKIGIEAPKKNMNSNDTDIDDINFITELTQDFYPYYEDHKNDEDAELSVDKKFFNEVKSRLKSLLEDKLGLELAANIEITQDGRGKPFYLNIDPESISIVEKF